MARTKLTCPPIAILLDFKYRLVRQSRRWRRYSSGATAASGAGTNGSLGRGKSPRCVPGARVPTGTPRASGTGPCRPSSRRDYRTRGRLMSSDLNAQKALIFRIVHRDNVPWMLDNGLHCPNSSIKDVNYVSIGNPELIGKRASRCVPCPPGGTLSDYVPFYFTPWSPMLYNIKTGWGGIRKRPNEEIVILVSSLRRLRVETVKRGLHFLRVH
jgi:ssDNA thymidine ADP-ribosyltransferase, DarT